MSKMESFIKITAALIIAVIAAGCSPKKTDEQKTIDADTEPHTELELEMEQEVDAVYVINSDINQLIQDKTYFIDYFKYLDFALPTYSDIRILGWSKDGKVAYSNYRVHEGIELSVYIFDIINDKIIWRNFAYDGNAESGNDFYLDFINDYKKVCVQNEIEFIQTEFMNLPARHNNQTVNIILEKKITSLGFNQLEDLGQYGGTVEGYTVIAENQGKRKVITDKNLQMYANDVFLCGYFISPFENRALIVIGEFAHVWEGSAVSYYLAGCHLSAGFN